MMTTPATPPRRKDDKNVLNSSFRGKEYRGSIHDDDNYVNHDDYDDDWTNSLMSSVILMDDNDDDNNNRRKNEIAAMAWFGGTVGIICGLTAPFVFTKTILPYMATPKSKVEAALRFCLSQKQKQHHQQYQHGQRQNDPHQCSLNHSLPVFVDIGSGDGEAVKQAAKLGYYAVGIELNLTMWLLSSVRRRFFFTEQERRHSKIVYGNMFDHSLGRNNNNNNNYKEEDEDQKQGMAKKPLSYARSGWNADVVMIFGVTPLMPSISQKLQKECKLGTYILSYRFGLPLYHPSIHDSSNLLHGRVIYDREEMRIYEKLEER